MTYTLETLKQLTGPPLSVAVAELVYGATWDPCHESMHRLRMRRSMQCDEFSLSFMEHTDGTITVSGRLSNRDGFHADPTAAIAALERVCGEDEGFSILLMNTGSYNVFLGAISTNSTGAEPGHEFATSVSRAACVVACMKREEN